jgi:hypothetical protein
VPHKGALLVIWRNPRVYQVRSCEVSRLYNSGGGVRYEPGKHRIVECDWIRTARRQTRRPDLFLYRHLRSGNYMLSHWIVRPNTGKGPGYFLDLEDMRGHPDKFTGWDGKHPALGMNLVRARLRPMDEMQREWEKQLAHQEWAQDQAEEETSRERKDVAKYLRNKGSKFDRAAWELEHGWSGFVGEREGGDHLQNIIELLRR